MFDNTTAAVAGHLRVVVLDRQASAINNTQPLALNKQQLTALRPSHFQTFIKTNL